MTTPRDPEALLTAYLAGGMEKLPERVVDAVLAEAHRTRQRVVFGPARTRAVSRTALAAAAVAAMLALGGAFLVFGGGPSPTPSPDPSPSLPGVVPPTSSPNATAPVSPDVAGPTGAWIATGSMGTPRTGHTAVRLLDGRVLVVGGYPGDEPDLAVTSAELYDPESGTWSTTGSMLRPYSAFQATLLGDGRVLVGDIEDPAADNPVRRAEVYDPETGTWSEAGTMVKDGGDDTATLLRDGTVLVTGQDGCQLYNPDSGTWTRTGAMIAGRHYRHGHVLLPDGRVLVAGGLVDDHGVASAELYDPTTGTWTAIADMHTSRADPTATLLLDGKVLVTGGADFQDPGPPELFDPATETWTAVGDFARPGARYSSATLLSDGAVLVTGDRDSSDAELYDPVTGSWTTTELPLQRHYGAPATLLPDGTILVAGGGTGSAELYVPAGMSPPPAVAALPTVHPTPTPTQTPSPTAVPPQAGPVPPGARPWEVTATNKSSQPATLFVADENEQGLLGQLVGSATPNVVPPGATVRVTFLLPAEGVKGWSIFVNPGPNNGGVVGWNDVPLAGEIRITEDGQVGWLSP